MYFAALTSNVPMKEGKLQMKSRIRAALPTSNYLVEQACESYFSKPLRPSKGQVVEEMRLTPVAARLGELLGRR